LAPHPKTSQGEKKKKKKKKRNRKVTPVSFTDMDKFLDDWNDHASVDLLVSFGFPHA